MAKASSKPAMTFSIDMTGADALADMLKQWPKAAQGAMIRAINKTLKQGRREAAKIITAKYNIKQKDVIDAVEQHRATNQRSTGWLQINPNRRPGLAKFGSTQNKKGVTYRTVKGQGRRLIPGAYQFPKKKAYWVAFRPDPNDRTKIRFLQGISVWGMFASLTNQSRVRDVIRQRFSGNLSESVKFEYLVRTGQIKRNVRNGEIVRGKP